MTTITECRELGLAAYIKMKGHKLVGCEGRVYMFECSPEKYREMEIEYANSSERVHDGIVMNLRQLQTKP